MNTTWIPLAAAIGAALIAIAFAIDSMRSARRARAVTARTARGRHRRPGLRGFLARWIGSVRP